MSVEITLERQKKAESSSAVAFSPHVPTVALISHRELREKHAAHRLQPRSLDLNLAASSHYRCSEDTSGLVCWETVGKSHFFESAFSLSSASFNIFYPNKWKCKYCPASCDKRAQLLKHYRLKHGTYARTEQFPCLHQECMCTFKSLNALHSHLSRFHNRSMDQLQTVDSQKKLLKNLKEEFFSVLDSLCPSFMDIFKRKTGGRMGKQLADLLQQTTSTEPTVTRCLILRGLPIILGDASIFFKSSLNDSMDIPVGIVMDTLTNLPQAMCLLFGFTYALHLQYPKCLKNTFIFIQQVMLNLGRSELPPKVQKLKNDLAV